MEDDMQDRDSGASARLAEWGAAGLMTKHDIS